MIFRFFNIFGPRQDPSSPYSGVISIFSERAAQGLPITVFGDGEQTRDFLYVGDLVHVMVQALEQPQVEEGAVNVGLNQATSLNQMLKALQQVVGSLPAISYGQARSGDIRHSGRTTSVCWRASTSRSRPRWSRAWLSCSAGLEIAGAAKRPQFTYAVQPCVGNPVP